MSRAVWELPPGIPQGLVLSPSGHMPPSVLTVFALVIFCLTRSQGWGQSSVGWEVWARKLFPVSWLLCGPRRYASSSFKAADLQLEVTQKPHKKPNPGETLVFGKTFTDHLLMVEWMENKGWSPPRIQPFQNLSLHPACSALHHSLQGPLARPRTSAQEQLERMRRNQECGRPLPRPASPRLLTLGRTLSPARHQPDVEQRPALGHSGTQKWLRSSGSWSSPRNNAPYLPTPEGHRERVLSLSQALAAEASQWHRMVTGGNLDSAGEPLPPVPPPPSNAKPQMTSPPRSPPVANSRSPGSSRGGGGRGPGPASGEPAWDAGSSPLAQTPGEAAWPLRVTLLQSSF